MGAYLPHWTAEGATYSVTFRLADALPAGVLEGLRRERAEVVAKARAMGRALTVMELARLGVLHSERVEGYLDTGSGACFMREPRIATMVEGALRHFDRERYDLFAWCVMPNHVHAVVRPLSGFGLSGIMHSRKSYSAGEANRLLGRTGAFWQRESYDHLVRDEQDFTHALRYVLENPERAGLKGWRWVGSGGALGRADRSVGD
ncbi:MAG: transposase [Phycisphaerales bacterium]